MYVQREGGKQGLIRGTKVVSQHRSELAERNHRYLDGFLKNINLPIYIVKLALHTLEIQPDKSRKFKEDRKEDDEKHVLIGSANGLQKRCFNTPG